MTLISMRYGPLLTALKVAWDVPSPAEEAFEGRIKNLRRLGFPPDESQGTAARIDYEAEDLVSIHAALHLQHRFLTPAAAVALLETGRRATTLFALDAISGFVGSGMSGDGYDTCLVCPPSALDELGTRPVRAGRYTPSVKPPVIRMIGLSRLMTARLPPGMRTSGLDGTVIEAEGFGRPVPKALAEIGVDPADLIADLCQRAMVEHRRDPRPRERIRTVSTSTTEIVAGDVEQHVPPPPPPPPSDRGEAARFAWHARSLLHLLAEDREFRRDRHSIIVGRAHARMLRHVLNPTGHTVGHPSSGSIYSATPDVAIRDGIGILLDRAKHPAAAMLMSPDPHERRSVKAEAPRTPVLEDFVATMADRIAA